MWINLFFKWFLNLRIGKKILYTYVLAGVVPFLIAQGIIFSIISKNMSEKVDTLITNQLLQIAERTNLTLEIYTNLVYQIYADNQIIDGIIEFEEENEQVKAKSYRKICDQIQKYGSTVAGIECISIILLDGQDITYDFDMASTVDNLWMDYQDMREIEPYIQAEEASNMIITPTRRFVQNGEEKRVFHISKKMYNFNDIQKGTIATIVISINELVLNKVCNVGTQTEEGEVYAINFILNNDRHVLSYPNTFYTGITLADHVTIERFVQNTKELSGKKIAVNQYKDKQLNWYFYSVYDKDYMQKDIRHVQELTVFISILLFVLSIILIHATIRLIEKSVQKIVDGIQHVQQGDLNIQVYVNSTDEMGQIADNFNTMTKKVQDLIRKVENISRKQHEAEIKALEAQINPHFLYNTLDSINWMAIEHEEYEISRMLRNLGVILRYSINKSNQMVTIAEMIDWLEKYISLQQMRFNEAFRYEIEVDEKVKEIYIYKLLIQPFVENAIIHGFKGIEEGGVLRIDISIAEEEEKLYIIIEDNGRGMPKEIAEKMNCLQEEDEEDGKSIGLYNAFLRMKMYYGKKATWDVSTITDIGTIITLKIPVQREKGDI